MKFTSPGSMPSSARTTLAFDRGTVDALSQTSLGSVDDIDRAFIVSRAKRIRTSRAKRVLDILIAGSMLVFLAPLLSVIALAIKLTSKGPVLFWQQRYGAEHTVFWICKFRTMRVMEAQGSFSQASRHDNRFTSIGPWLRKASLDELPQLFNVLNGSMSLVGPRPHAIAMDDHFTAIIPALPARHLVRPGLTGLAQIHGFRGPTDEADSMARRVIKDVDYIRSWSLRTDITILAKTPAALLRTSAF